MEIPPVRLVFDGYRRGFLDARPSGTVKEVFLGNWEDVAGARQATLALVAQGADVVIHNADAAGLGVFQACREQGVLAIGTNSDQAAVAPDVVLASAVMDIPEAMVRVARDVQSGSFSGRVYRFDLASGVVDLALNPELASALPAAATGAVEEARRQVLEGTVELEHFGG
jgi:basic membrane lipoprotein Med (substrate-binding protein (PBP1-ABC) superfamily)